MPQDATEDQYAMLVQLDSADVENVQAIASVWGDIRRECKEFEVEIEESYTVLGPADFLVILRAPSRTAVLEAAVMMTRHGLDVRTMGIIPTDEFADLVEDQ